MPTYFPQIGSSGIISQLPYNKSQRFNSIYQASRFGRPYSTSRRGSGLNYYATGPLSDFQVAYTAITDAEVQTLLTFFNAQQGKYGEFIFLDPAGNLINNSEDFSQTSWTSQETSVSISATGVADPWGGTRATTLTATSSNSNLSPIVIPSGSLPTGFVLSASVYLRALAANQTLAIGFVDSGFSVLGSQTWSLPQNKWKRIDFSLAISSTSYIRVLFGGFGTWNSTAIQFFGPSCVPTLGPGAYKKSPADYGLHAKCRFDTDSFTSTAIGPNQNRLTLPIQEINS